MYCIVLYGNLTCVNISGGWSGSPSPLDRRAWDGGYRVSESLGVHPKVIHVYEYDWMHELIF